MTTRSAKPALFDHDELPVLLFIHEALESGQNILLDLHE